MAKKNRPPIPLPAGKGRAYDMGAMRAVFKADGKETAQRYSISEWWLEPGAPGPGAHRHEHEDDCFYVIEGTAHFLIGRRWVKAPRGTFVCAPAGVAHDFAPHEEEGRHPQLLDPRRIREGHAGDRQMVHGEPLKDRHALAA